jgi:predicted KAP-like P-loop ATPase
MDGPDIADILQTYRDRFAKLVQKVLQSPRDKLVIMIDDLDRVRPVRALEMLESIKNFVDVPGCVFVLAVDYGVILQGVADRLGREAQLTHGKSYFDKIRVYSINSK